MKRDSNIFSMHFHLKHNLIPYFSVPFTLVTFLKDAQGSIVFIQFQPYNIQLCFTIAFEVLMDNLPPICIPWSMITVGLRTPSWDSYPKNVRIVWDMIGGDSMLGARCLLTEFPSTLPLKLGFNLEITLCGFILMCNCGLWVVFSV